MSQRLRYSTNLVISVMLSEAEASGRVQNDSCTFYVEILRCDSEWRGLKADC
jgi:hypothetical protein